MQFQQLSYFKSDMKWCLRHWIPLFEEEKKHLGLILAKMYFTFIKFFTRYCDTNNLFGANKYILLFLIELFLGKVKLSKCLEQQFE